MAGLGTLASSAPWSTAQQATASPEIAAEAARTTVAQCVAAVTAVAAIVIGGHLAASGLMHAMPRTAGGLGSETINHSGPLLIAFIQLALFVLVVTWFTRDRWAGLGVAMPDLRIWHWLAIVVGLYALKAALSIAALAAASAHAGAGPTRLPTEGLAPFAAVMKSNAWLLLLAGGILAAVVEELLYRGYLSKTLEGSLLGFWGGALVASVIWSGLHLYYPLSLQIVLAGLGLALSWLRLRTGSVLPGMLWHVVNNAIGLIALRALV